MMSVGRTPDYERDDVISSAARAFGMHGYAGTSIDTLVTATGVHRGSLYKEFGSKRGLFVAALQRCISDEFQSVGESLGAADSAGDVLRVISDSTALDLLVVAAVEFRTGDDEMQRLVMDALATLGAAGSHVNDAGRTLHGFHVLSTRLAISFLTKTQLKNHLDLCRQGA